MAVELIPSVALAGLTGADWAFAAQRAAQDLDDALGDAEVMRSVVERVAEVARTRGARVVVGASATGSAIAAAVAAREPNVFQARAPRAADQVAVVDGVVASGTQLVVAARRARKVDAKVVCGIGVVVDPGAIEPAARLHELEIVPITTA